MIRGVAAGGLSIALCLLVAPALAGTEPAAAAVSAAGTPAAVTAGPLPNPTGSCTPPKPGQPDPGTENSSHPTVSFSPVPKNAGTPWAQTTLSYSSVWKFTEGSGETVALIDSGVDANPQLNGRVETGKTFVNAPSGPPGGDCVGHGTMAAGLIVATPQNGGLSGVAPEAKVYSEKITNSEQIPEPSVIAQAIDDAVKNKVQVINLSLDVTFETPQEAMASSLYAAVENAISNNVVVVVAAGNDEPDQNGKVSSGPFYPANFPGVLSVGAVNQDGSLASFSDQKTQVGVTAPGADMMSTYPGASGDSYAVSQGTSFAAPLVAGLAALVRARYPQLSAPQVIQRIEKTADGNEGPGTGYGLINPVEALTAVIPSQTTSASSSVTITKSTTDGTPRKITLALTGGALAIVAIALAAAVVIPAGRRRRWRPGA